MLIKFINFRIANRWLKNMHLGLLDFILVLESFI